MWLNKVALNELCGKTKEPDEYYVNCGGYAFGVDSWYQCGTPHGFNDDVSKAFRKNCGWRNLERKYVKEILKDNPGWQLLKKEAVDDVAVDTEKYQIVAFKLYRSWIGGYHFIRCEKNGDWTWKNGHLPQVHRCRYEEVYDVWKYDGRIWFFIKERS